MIKPVQQQLQRFRYRLICQQLLWVGLLAAAFGGLAGWHAAMSAIYAGGILVLSNAYFAYRAFKTTGATSARQIMNGFYLGEAIKLLMAGLLFAIVMKYGNIHPVAFFVTLVIVQLGYFMSLLLMKSPLRGD